MKRKNQKMVWEKARDIQKQISIIIHKLNLTHIKPAQIVCFRSFNSTSRARARIWSLPQVWQLALDVTPHYVIEVLSEKYDNLPDNEKLRTLIHELMHIPKTFSGSLVPHRGRFHRIDNRTVETLFKIYLKCK